MMYGQFAKVYDRFQEMDYPAFLDFYQKVFKRLNISPKLVLDLACGTGNITLSMAEAGYDMIGLDLSPQMLQIALEKAQEREQDILFLHQDMTDFELYGTVDAVICALDGVNYVETPEQIDRMFHWVENYLNPGGVMIFDINSAYKLKEVLADRSFVYEDEESYCVWNNLYDEETRTAYFDINLFVLEEDGRYTRYDEEQREYAHTTEALIESAERAGLQIEGVYGGFDFSPPVKETERIFFVLRKKEG